MCDIRRILVPLIISLFCLSVNAATMTLPNGEVLKDPTQPFEWAKPAHVNKAKRVYKLNYLLYAPERKYAIVNGKTVSVGDYVSGAKVLKINESSVLLSTGDGTQVLRWKRPMSIKRKR